MSDFLECPTCKEMANFVDHVMAGTHNVRDRYDELVRQLIFAIDELVDEDGNTHTDRLDDALHEIKNWLGYFDGRNDALCNWSERKS